MWNLKYDMNIFMKQKQTERTDLRFPSPGGHWGREVRMESLELADANY